MQGSELVRRAIRFQHPERLSVVFDSLGVQRHGRLRPAVSVLDPWAKRHRATG